MKINYWWGVGLLPILLCTCGDPNRTLQPQKLIGPEDTILESLLPPELIFRWSVKDSAAVGSVQVLVADDKTLLDRDLGNIWDSQRQFGQKTGLTCKDCLAVTGKPSWWKMRLWDTSGIAGPWSSVKKFSLPSGEPLQRWVGLGGSLMAGMEQDHELEMTLFQLFPGQGLTFRNLGWAADDVYGLARSSFGSAQNTRSWQPPSAEEGFGSRVLFDQLLEARPQILLVGYGPETAFFTTEAEWNLFTSGYERLLHFTDSLQIRVVILSPPKQEKIHQTGEDLPRYNQQLGRTRDWLKDVAGKRKFTFIDLFEELISDPQIIQFTSDGIQLNRAGYQRLTQVILNNLGYSLPEKITVCLDSTGRIKTAQHGQVTAWQKTVRGLKFKLTNQSVSPIVSLDLPVHAAVYVDGQLVTKGQGPFQVMLPADSIRQEKIKQLIVLKNQMHRYRLRPLNEAYIYLFRRHEMGHLSYEMDHFQRLAAEYEAELAEVLLPRPSDITIELIQSWQPPKNYVEDEVPAFIPAPNIAEELQAFRLPPGFEINLFAADPMIANPINISWDTRGRAWVATSSTYPHPVPGREPNDKIVILEDTDADGQADKYTVFAEGLLIPHAVMPAPGGAYVTATTELLFLEDRNGDDMAEQKRVIFDGFGNADVHHTIHGLRWAPWGDLHFTQSIYINSFIETVHGPRRLNGSGIWSYRPETGHLDIFARGLINPWGEAWDAWGQTFATDGAGSSGVNYVFPESAHATAVGAERVLLGLNSGTPKNIGAEIIYSRHLPASWQGSLITADFRANRTVRYALTPQGSGYTAKEVETIITSDHRSFRPVDMKIGPDGALYVVDWYNPIIDHGEVDFHHPVRDKSHGRIWRITQKNKPALPIPKIYGSSLAALLNLLKSPEQFTRLQANRELVAQKCPSGQLKEWIQRLDPRDPAYDHHRLEGLWLSSALGNLDEDLLNALLLSKHHQVRAATLRMTGQWQKGPQFLTKLGQLVQDPHPQVRLESIHALRSVGTTQAMEIALDVLNQPMDDNLDFALWQTARMLKSQWLPALTKGKTTFNNDINQQVFALLACDEPEAIQWMARQVKAPQLKDTLAKQAWQKMARLGGPTVLDQVMEEALRSNPEALLQAMHRGPESNKNRPTTYLKLLPLLEHDSTRVRSAAIQLAGRWEVKESKQILSTIAQNADLKLPERVLACRALIKFGDQQEVSAWAKSSSDPAIKTTAMAAWMEKDLTLATPAALQLLQQLDSTELIELIFATFRRVDEGPDQLIKALDGQKLSEKVASVGLRVAQTSGLNLAKLEQKLREAGSLTSVGTAMTAEEKQQLLQEAIATGNPSRGWTIFRRPQLLCAACHRVRDIGGLIGPELTTIGTFMTPAAILEAVVNPNADIKQNYETYIVTKTSGEVISGILHRKTGSAILLKQTSGDVLTIPLNEIAKQEISANSLMPAGLTASLHKDELRDLLGFMLNLGVKK